MPEQIVFDVLTGDLPKKERERVITKLNSGQCKALVATIHLVGEGVDLPSLRTISERGGEQCPISGWTKQGSVKVGRKLN